MPERWQKAGFGLYIHWPFCQAKCPYCDFNSHVSQAITQTDWSTAYLKEIDRVGAETGPRVLRSIYFGGGTPSLMEPEVVSAVIDRAARTWTFANDIEITLEANPTSSEAGRFKGYAAAGVNRVSLGVQALNDDDLQRLGRLHSVNDALAAVTLARSILPRVSFDLIYGRQDQTLDAWETELTRALGFDPDHLSLYQLTVEPGTVFAKRHAAGHLTGMPDIDLEADFFELTNTTCSEAGLPAYEISNFARKGQESRHNLIYWNGGDWAGIGPGAHGRLTINGRRVATETAKLPQAWIDRVASLGTGETIRETLGAGDQMTEALTMGLRTIDGIDLSGMSEAPPPALLRNINTLQNLGLVQREEDRLRLTRDGWPLLNSVVAELLRD